MTTILQATTQLEPSSSDFTDLFFCPKTQLSIAHRHLSELRVRDREKNNSGP